MKTSFSIRQARQKDEKVLRDLIRSARINILGIDFRRFIVAVDENDRVIGCGQIKVHKDGSRELASIVVEPSWQGIGAARAIIVNLVELEDRTLWLMCRSDLVSFYEKFGFIEITEPLDMPSYFRRIKRLWRIVVRVTKRELSVMCRKCDPPGNRADWKLSRLFHSSKLLRIPLRSSEIIKITR